MHACQTRTLGVDIRAGVGAVKNKKALMSAVADDDATAFGGILQRGGFMLQMKAEDFPLPPTHDTPVVCNGDAAGQKLVVTNINLVSGIYNITVGDPSA